MGGLVWLESQKSDEQTKTAGLGAGTSEHIPTSALQLESGGFQSSLDAIESRSHASGIVSKFSRQQKYILGCLCLCSVTSYCVIGIMAPFFPTEAEMKGMSMTMSGVIFSVYAVVIFLASPLMGELIPRFSTKTFLLLGLCLSGLCNIIFGFLFYIQSLPAFTATCIITRLLDGLGAAAYVTATYSITGEVFPENIGFVLGISEIFTGLGLSLGPAIGGVLYEVGGAGLPFWFVGLFVLTSALISSRHMPSAVLATEQQATPTLHSWSLFYRPKVVVILLAVVVISTGWSFLDPILEPYLRKNFGVSQSMVGLIFFALSVCYALSSPLWGLLTEKLEETWGMVVVGLIGCSVSTFLLGPTPSIEIPNTIWMKVVAMMIFGVFAAMSLLPTFGILLNLAIQGGYTDDNRTLGLISGFWASLYSLGEVLGPLSGALVTEHFDFATTTTAMSTLFILTAIITFLYFGGVTVVQTKSKKAFPPTPIFNHPESDSGLSELENDLPVDTRAEKKSPTQSEYSPLLPSHA